MHICSGIVLYEFFLSAKCYICYIIFDMIPKIVHYCWFGHNPLPPLAIKCIDSWKKFLPDYEIREWNEDNFDVNAIPYTKEAYATKKYAFVSDYARFEILYKYGGLYFDTDVEVIKPLDDIVARGSFMGCENVAEIEETMTLNVAPGLGLGVVPGLGLYKEMLELYASLHFLKENGEYNQKTVVQYTTEVLCRYGLKNVNDLQQVAGVWIYPKDYFCPISTYDGKLRLTANTVSIHHYAQSWISPSHRILRNWVLKIGGGRLKSFLVELRRILMKKN